MKLCWLFKYALVSQTLHSKVGRHRHFFQREPLIEWQIHRQLQEPCLGPFPL